MTAGFLAAAVLLSAGALAFHAHYSGVIRAASERLLTSTIEIKLDQLLRWRGDRVRGALSLLDSRLLQRYLARLAADAGDREAASVVSQRLASFIRYNQYPFAAVAGSSGRVLVSAGEKPERYCPGFKALIARSAASGRPEMGDFYITDGEPAPHIDIVLPAYASSGGARLALLLRVNPADFLYPLLQTWSARGETGELLLAARDGDDVLFLNDLRHVRDAALRLRRPLATPHLPSALALKGGSGVVKAPDYRGVEVLAAYAPVPGTNWGMVVKMDWEEVMHGVGTVRALLLLLVLALTAAAGAVAYALFLWQAEKTEETLARLTDQVPGVVYQYRLYPDGRSCFPYSSSGMELIYEVTSAEVREDATPVFGRLHPDDLKSTSEAIFASARDLSIFHWEFRVVLPRQGLRWRMCDARPERLPDGGTLWYGIITDITERKRAEEALAALAQQRQLALDSAQLGWWRYSPATRLAFYDERYKEIFEVAGSSKPNDEILKRLHPDDLPAVWASVEEALDPAKRKPYAAQYRVVIPGGHVKWVEAHGMAIFGGDGNEPGETVLVGTVQDITERKRAEETLQKLNRGLSDKNREMENFLYITTHDLRSPLVNIQGFSQNLQQYLGEIRELLGAAPLNGGDRARAKKLGESKVPEALGFILESSAKMDALIGALLKVSRLGRQELKPERLDVGAMLAAIQDAMRFQLRETGAEIKVSPLPPCRADALSVNQLFSNLIDNAVKYRSPDRSLRLEVSGETAGGKAVYRVSDNGQGIPEDELEKIWDVFYRPPRPGQRKGEGIGLPMARRIAERNGGAIRAESRAGAGTVFTVELPAAGEGT